MLFRGNPLPSERKIRKMMNRYNAMYAKLRKDCDAYEAVRNGTATVYQEEDAEGYSDLRQDWAFLEGDLDVIFEDHPEREIREAVGRTIEYSEGKILENELRLGTGLTEGELRKVFRYQTDHDSKEGLRAAELLGLTRRQYLLHIYRKSFKPYQREKAGKELGYSPLRVWLHHFSMEGRDRGYLEALKREADKRPPLEAAKLLAQALYQWMGSG